MRLFLADFVLAGDALVQGGAVLASGDGRVAFAGPEAEARQHAKEASRAAGSGSGSRSPPEGVETVDLRGHLILPGLVCAHSHAFQVLLRGRAAEPRSFRDWVDRQLYPLVRAIDEPLLRAASHLAFAEMARAGITSVGEFHYIHNREGDAAPLGARLGAAVAEEARGVGLRVALLRALYDARERPGQERFAEEPARAKDAVRELRERFRGDPAVTVGVAPHSLHGASEAMLRAGVELSEELQCPLHVHLAEQRSDIDLAVKRYGRTPLHALAALGALGSRTVVVHGLWLDEGERERLALSGLGLVRCPATNLHLGDGWGPIDDLVARGFAVALGSDANQAPDVLLEMRAAEHLERLRTRQMGALGGAAALLRMGTSSGARALGLEAGTLAPGRWCDLIAIDLADPSLLPASSPEWRARASVGAEGLLDACVFSLVAPRAVRHAYVAAEPIVRDGRLARTCDPGERLRALR